MIKLVLSDMDGTLLDEKGHLPQEFAGFAAKLKKKGILFAPASGRQYFSLLDTFSQYKDDFVFIAENGAIVMYQGEEVFSWPMERKASLDALATLQEKEQVLSVFCGKKNGYILRGQEQPQFLAELSKYYTHHALADNFPDIDDVPIKLSFYDPEGNAEHSILPLMKRFASVFQVTLSSSWWVDLMAPGANKGNAVSKVQKRFGISREETAAFGDYLNDMEMIAMASYGFAMENAHPKLKEAARYTAKSNKEHGVFRSVEWLEKEGLM